MNSTGHNRPHPFLQLGILFGLVTMCLFLCLFIVKFSVCRPFLALPIPTCLSLRSPFKNNTRTLRSLCSRWHLLGGCFCCRAIIFTLVMRYDVGRVFQSQSLAFPQSTSSQLRVVIACGIVFVNFIVELNKQIPLPDRLSYLRDTQGNADALIVSFFSENSNTHFFVLVLALAILPAIAEELFFRGVIQNMLQKSGMTAMAAIVVTGFSFSVMHLEFDNFVAIWMMGIVLGWLYYYSQNLWVSIIAHFLNNFSMIALKFAFFNGVTTTDMSETTSPPILLSLVCGIIMVLLLLWFRKRNQSAVLVSDAIDS
jgi:membrane protease YdiL (CAAX protease family)